MELYLNMTYKTFRDYVTAQLFNWQLGSTFKTHLLWNHQLNVEAAYDIPLIIESVYAKKNSVL